MGRPIQVNEAFCSIKKSRVISIISTDIHYDANVDYQYSMHLLVQCTVWIEHSNATFLFHYQYR